METPIWRISNDTAIAVQCAQGNYTNANSYDRIGGNARPIYYINNVTRRSRNDVWQQIVKDETLQWGNKMN